MADIHRGFQEVDHAPRAQTFFDFLDAANASESIQTYRQRMLEICPPQAGDHILDIGCGIGHSASALASKVGLTGAVVGIDKSDTLIAEATRRARGSAAPPRYQVGDARRITFDDHSFDICRIERVLMYVDAPEEALDEMLRVLRPGGQFAVFEFDYDCIVVDASDLALTRRIVRLVSNSIPSPWVGRQLPRLLRERGAEALTIIPHMIATPLDMFRRVIDGTVRNAVDKGELLSEEIDGWWRDLDRSERNDRFFAGFFGFIVCGRSGDAVT